MEKLRGKNVLWFIGAVIITAMVYTLTEHHTKRFFGIPD